MLGALPLQLLCPESLRQPRKSAKNQAGFSLLEVLVAFSIMAMSLALIYRLSGGSVRTVAQIDEKLRAVSLAESILDSRDFLPEDGWNEIGESAGMKWQVQSKHYVTGVGREYPLAVPLYELQVSVSWTIAGQPHEVSVQTLRPQRKAAAVIGGR